MYGAEMFEGVYLSAKETERALSDRVQPSCTFVLSLWARGRVGGWWRSPAGELSQPVGLHGRVSSSYSGTPELVLLLTFPQQPACPQPPLPPSQALCRAVARRAPLSQRTKAASKQPPRLRFTPRRAGTGNHLGNKTKKKQNTLAREIYHNGAF